MANYPQELAQDTVCQSHTGHMTGLWFLPTRPLRLNTNEWWMNIYIYNIYYPFQGKFSFSMLRQSLVGQDLLIIEAFTIILRHIKLGRTPPDEWYARRSNLYLTAHNTHNRQTSMPPAGFEPAIPASERPQTHALGNCSRWDLPQHSSAKVSPNRIFAVGCPWILFGH